MTEWIDPDPSPREMVVTDFSDIWKLQMLVEDGPLLPVDDDEVQVERHDVERIERLVRVERTLGRRSWTEESVVTVYRSVPRCGARWFDRCTLTAGHDGMHRSTGFAWSSDGTHGTCS